MRGLGVLGQAAAPGGPHPGAVLRALKALAASQGGAQGPGPGGEDLAMLAVAIGHKQHGLRATAVALAVAHPAADLGLQWKHRALHSYIAFEGLNDCNICLLSVIYRL